MLTNEKKSTIKEMLNFIDNMLNENEIKGLWEKYCYHPGMKTLSANGHRVIAGKALHLAERVFKNGGTRDEFILALKNLEICIDAMKHKLDYRQFQIDNGIKELSAKYPVRKGV